MLLLRIVFDVIAMTAGSFVVAAAAAFLAWQAFKPFNRPEWGPILAFAAMLVFHAAERPRRELLAMSLLFTGLAALVAWPEGARWRNPRKLDRLFGAGVRMRGRRGRIKAG